MPNDDALMLIPADLSGLALSDTALAELLRPWPTNADLAELLQPVDLSGFLQPVDLSELVLTDDDLVMAFRPHLG